MQKKCSLTKQRWFSAFLLAVALALSGQAGEAADLSHRRYVVDSTIDATSNKDETVIGRIFILRDRESGFLKGMRIIKYKRVFEGKKEILTELKRREFDLDEIEKGIKVIEEYSALRVKGTLSDSTGGEVTFVILYEFNLASPNDYRSAVIQIDKVDGKFLPTLKYSTVNGYSTDQTGPVAIDELRFETWTWGIKKIMGKIKNQISATMEIKRLPVYSEN